MTVTRKITITTDCACHRPRFRIPSSPSPETEAASTPHEWFDSLPSSEQARLRRQSEVVSTTLSDWHKQLTGPDTPEAFRFPFGYWALARLHYRLITDRVRAQRDTSTR